MTKEKYKAGYEITKIKPLTKSKGGKPEKYWRNTKKEAMALKAELGDEYQVCYSVMLKERWDKIYGKL